MRGLGEVHIAQWLFSGRYSVLFEMIKCTLKESEVSKF